MPTAISGRSSKGCACGGLGDPAGDADDGDIEGALGGEMSAFGKALSGFGDEGLSRVVEVATMPSMGPRRGRWRS
jgi:spore coat protein CotH